MRFGSVPAGGRPADAERTREDVEKDQSLLCQDVRQPRTMSSSMNRQFPAYLHTSGFSERFSQAVSFLNAAALSVKPELMVAHLAMNVWC